MRVLRSSVFVDMDAPPLVLVERDSDVIDSLESIAIQAEEPGLLMIHDIFDMPDSSIEAATMQAMERIDDERERNMALLFFWSRAHFPLLNPGGILCMDRPAPLEVQDISYVFERLKAEPGYQDFRLEAIAEDGTEVQLGPKHER